MNDLEKEIEALRYQLSEAIPEELNNILGMSDHSDNSEFSEILERQHFISVRLKQLTERLNFYRSVKLHEAPKDTVGIGSLIKVQNIKTNQILTYKLIISELSDEPSEEFSEITIQSPLGKAFIHRTIDEVISVKLPTEVLTCKILEISASDYL
jgi:transcription elongation factor GreA